MKVKKAIDYLNQLNPDEDILHIVLGADDFLHLTSYCEGEPECVSYIPDPYASKGLQSYKHYSNEQADKAWEQRAKDWARRLKLTDAKTLKEFIVRTLREEFDHLDTPDLDLYLFEKEHPAEYINEW